LLVLRSIRGAWPEEPAVKRWLLVVSCVLLSAYPGAFDASAASQAGRPDPARPPQLWAIVIGIDAPIDPAIPKTQTSVEQADRLARWLGGVAKWDRSHILLLTDAGRDDPGQPTSPAPRIRPTRKNLDWAFSTWLIQEKRPRADDVVLVYYAGPSVGLSEAAVPGQSPPVRQTVLLPIDSQLAAAAQTGWSLDRALEPLARQGQCQVVCWLESDPGRLTTRAAGQADRPVVATSVGHDWLQRLTRWPKVTAWLGADSPPLPADAPPRPPASAPLFTPALLKALGKGDHRPNLAACLKALQFDAALKLHGFRFAGGVPPSLTIWSDRFGRLARPQPPEMVLQVGHPKRVTALAVSADGQRVFTAGEDSTTRVWSLESQSLLRVLSGQMAGVTALDLSADGRWLVTGGGRGRVFFYDVVDHLERRPTDRQPHVTEAEDAAPRIVQVLVLPDGERAVTLDAAGKSYIWDLNEAVPAPRPWMAEHTCLGLAAAGDADTGLVAARFADGSVRLFGPAGKVLGVLRQPQAGAGPGAIAVSGDARHVALAFPGGRVDLHEIGRSARTLELGLLEDVERVAFVGPDHIAVAHRAGVTLIRLGTNLGLGPRIELGDGPIADLAIAPDGRRLAFASRDTGALEAWELVADAPADLPIARRLFRHPTAGVYQLAFAQNGDILIGGGVDISVKSWRIDPPSRGESPDPNWQSPPSGGKVNQVSVSADRSWLLIRSGKIVRSWRLCDRTCNSLPGLWSAALIAPDSRAIFATSSPDFQEAPGRLVRIDPTTFERNNTFFASSAEGFTLPDNTAFEVIAVSPDGRLVAASDGQAPLVCVWDTVSGALRYWIEDGALAAAPESLSFSSDGKLLATGGGSPIAQVWELPAEKGPLGLAEPFADLRDPVGRDVTCVAARPGAALEVFTGQSDGRVLRWTWPGKPGPSTSSKILESAFDGSVHTIAFSADSKNLAVGGDSTSIWFGTFDSGWKRQVDRPGPAPHHAEQIQDLAFIGANRLVSCGDDGAIRFWDLDKKSLQSTYVTIAPPAEVDPPVADPDWVVFTPLGLFDASARGRDLVRYRDVDVALPLEQFDGVSYNFGLAELALKDPGPDPPAALEKPLPIAIETAERSDPAEPDAWVTVTLGSPAGAPAGPGPARDVVEGVTDVRLYHNGVPVPTGLEDAPGPPPRQFRVKVPLVEGPNRFYAMASRLGAADSRSPESVVRYDGKQEPGRVHVIAIGVGEYDRLRLTYPTIDAERISEVLHDRGLDARGRKGIRRMLSDKEVTRDAIDKAFAEIVPVVKDQPQDTVVVFLAGHTGILDNERFCLLLPRFPFGTENDLLAANRAITNIAPGAKLGPEHTLPFGAVMKNLMRLNALNRLVIVDACQADAILVDPQVTELRKWMEIGTRHARTSYLLAARRGELAIELPELGHGLFTFTLLRGLGAVTDEDLPEPVAQLSLPENADANHDGALSTVELDAYVKRALPRIAGVYPNLKRIGRAADEPGLPPPNLQAAPDITLQATEESFPVVPVAPGG
jgi:WD40 repeat protein